MLHLVPAVLGVLAATAVYRLLALRGDAIPAQVALAGVFVCLAIGVVPFAGLHVLLLGDTTTVRGWGDVGARVCITIAAGLAQVYLLMLSLDGDDAKPLVRRRLGAAAAVGMCLIALGAVTPSSSFGTPPLDSLPESATHLVFLSFVTVTLCDVARSAWRWARATDGALRAGLALVITGSACGVGYALLKGVLVLQETSGGKTASPLVEAARAAALLGLILVAAGTSLPGAVRAARSVTSAVRAHRRLDVLYPLWSAVVDAVPAVALEPVQPRWRDQLHVRDLDVRLYRRVIEIRDGQLALRDRTPDCGSADGRLIETLASVAPLINTEEQPGSMEEEVEWWSRVARSMAGPGRQP